MAGISLLTYMESQFKAARREIRELVIDFRVPDDKLLQLRAEAQRLLEEVKELERKSAKNGLFGFLKILTYKA